MTPTTSHRLGIDYGTTHTVAYLETADGNGTRAQPLLFDSSPLLSSAVFADPGGRLLTGRDSERSARLDPTRYEPNPKRRIDEAIVLLGNDEFPVARVISAVLARVATEASRFTGGAPVQTVLTHPANWGTHRKDVLVQAAAAAGLTSVTVVPEPVAAAAHFTGVLGRTVNPGEALAVYDFGAGTFDASLVRLRDADGTWELLASEGLDDVGGLDLDATLVDLIGRVVAQRDPQRWHQLVNPSDTQGRRASRTFWDDVRAAKEQLSRTPTAAVHVPLFDTDTHLTREEFEAAARPLLDRTVALTASLVERAAPTRLAGVYMVGGSSRIPLIATLLHQRLNVAPTLIDTPELLVAQGSLRAAPGPSPGFAAPSAPGDRGRAPGPAGFAAPAGYPPPGTPVHQPAGHHPPHAQPGYGPPAPPPGFAAPAAYGSPAAPTSNPPAGYGAPGTAPGAQTPPGGYAAHGAASGAHTPPAAPTSAPTLGIPTSAVPASGAPSSGPPHPTSGAPGDPGGLPPVPAGMPLWGNTPTQAGPYGPAHLGDPVRRPARASRGRSTGWIVAAAAALLLLVGGGAVAFKTFTDDDGRSGNPNATGADDGRGGDSTAIQPEGAGAKIGDGGAAQAGTYTVDKTVWYQGLKFTVKTVSYDPALKDDPLTMDITVENTGTDGQNNVRYTDVFFTYDGAITEGAVEEVQSLPGKSTSEGKLVFEPEKPVTDLRKGELSIGRADTVQPKIPFGALDKATTLEPKKVAGPVDEKRSGVLGMKLQHCEQRADYPADHQQAKKDYMFVVCVVDLKSYKQSIYDHGVWKSNFLLKLPNGTTTTPERIDNTVLNQNQQKEGVPMSFTIRWPAPGAYALQFYDAGRLGNEAPDAERPVVEVPMTLT